MTTQTISQNADNNTPATASTRLKGLFWAAVIYMALGLITGLYYREITKANDFSPNDFTQLSTLHTHFFALGMLVMLIVLVLERLFTLSAHRKLFASFMWLYNGGLVLTTIMMLVHGTIVVGGGEGNAMIAGIAGLGHMFLTAGLIVLFVALGRRISKLSDSPKN